MQTPLLVVTFDNPVVRCSKVANDAWSSSCTSSAQTSSSAPYWSSSNTAWHSVSGNVSAHFCCTSGRHWTNRLILPQLFLLGVYGANDIFCVSLLRYQTLCRAQRQDRDLCLPCSWRPLSSRQHQPCILLLQLHMDTKELMSELRDKPEWYLVFSDNVDKSKLIN